MLYTVCIICKLQISCVINCDGVILQVLLNVIADTVGSWWLALIFQTSHVISEVGNVLLGVI